MGKTLETLHTLIRVCMAMDICDSEIHKLSREYGILEYDKNGARDHINEIRTKRWKLDQLRIDTAKELAQLLVPNVEVGYRLLTLRLSSDGGLSIYTSGTMAHVTMPGSFNLPRFLDIAKCVIVHDNLTAWEL